MASLLFMCVKCLRTMRIVGRVPADFDEVCDDCRITEMSHAGDVEGTQSEGTKEARVEGATNPQVGRRNAARKGTGKGK